MKNNKTLKKTNIKRTFYDFSIITVGAIIYALGIVLFTAPNNIAPGGASGIGTMVNFISGIPIGTTVIIVNIPLFIISFVKFGLSFIKKTVYATFLSSVLIDTLPMILEKHYIYSPLLAAIFGGVCIGAGVGIIFLRGGTTGGADILAKLINQKLTHLSMGTLVFAIDAIVVLSTIFVYRNIESLLYSAISFFCYFKSYRFHTFRSCKKQNASYNYRLPKSNF